MSNMFINLLQYACQLISSLLSSSTCKLAATRPLPSYEGCGPPYINIDGFRVGVAPHLGLRQLRSERGDPWYGRPARYATRRTTAGSPLSFYVPCHLLTSKTPQDTYHPLTRHKFCRVHQYLTLASMASTNSTMSSSNNARTDANSTHQRTNDVNNDGLGGHCRAASSARPF